MWKKAKKILLRPEFFPLALAFLGALILFGSSLRGSDGKRVEKALPVSTLTLEPVHSYSVTRSYSGEVVPRQKSALAFERNGKIAQVFVEEGEEVKKGQTLATLDVKLLKVKKKELEARLVGARAKLREMVHGPREETIAAHRARVEDLKERVQLQKKKKERRKKLLAREVIPTEELDEIDTSLQSLKARLKGAQKELENLIKGTRVEKISAQKALMDQIRAQREEVEINLEKSLLKAPFDSRISKRKLHPGAVISAGEPILHLVETRVLEVRIGLPVGTASSLDRESRFPLRIGGEIYRASLEALSPQLHLSTRTVTAIFRLTPKKGANIFPGQIAYLQLRQDIPTRAFWLPTTALVRGHRGLWSCLVLKADPQSKEEITEKRHLEIIHSESDRHLVQGDLSPGEKVIAEGTHRVVPGQLVEAVQNSEVTEKEASLK